MDLTLLGAPIFEGRAVDNDQKNKIATPETSIKRLSTLESHDALCLLKDSIATSKLLYILQTSPCANGSMLQQIDMVLKNGLEPIFNVQVSDTQ